MTSEPKTAPSLPDLSRVAPGLVPNAEGLWVARQAAAAGLSYPEDGNQSCFQVEDRSFWFGHRNACILAALARFPPTGPLLDVGGGNGFVTRALLDAGQAATLLEPGPGARVAHQARALPQVIQATLAAAEFVPGTWGAVAAFDVIEHLADDRAFVQELWQAVAPGGLLFATVPAFQSLWSAADPLAGHFRRYDLAATERLLAGLFTPLYATYFFQPLVLPLFLLRSLPYRLGRRSETLLETADEHGVDQGLGVRLLQRLLRREVTAIANGRRLAWGTSCLVVARKLAD